MAKLRFSTIVVASVLAIGGTFATGSIFATGQAQAAVQGGADAIRAASEGNALTEQVQFRFSGRDYCWADDGWHGPGWYWCGYAYRVGFGWGGGIGWNNWRREEFREHREIREFHDHDRDRDRDRGRDHDRDDRRRY
jgi:hypothetical protein